MCYYFPIGFSENEKTLAGCRLFLGLVSGFIVLFIMSCLNLRLLLNF